MPSLTFTFLSIKARLFFISEMDYNREGQGTYAHIWELRQNLPANTTDPLLLQEAPKQRSNSDSAFLPHTDGQLPRALTRTQRDHVYESPKPPEGGEDGYYPGDIPFYHEFDPNNPMPSRVAEVHHSNVNNNLARNK